MDFFYRDQNSNSRILQGPKILLTQKKLLVTFLYIKGRESNKCSLNICFETKYENLILKIVHPIH
jgi:hypothetical protein